jgi:hypothetical protein
VHGSIIPLAGTAVKNFLLRSFDVSSDEAAGFVSNKISQWSKISFLNGGESGDTIRAVELVQQSEQNMTRDASLLKVIPPPLTSDISQCTSTPTMSLSNTVRVGPDGGVHCTTTSTRGFRGLKITTITTASGLTVTGLGSSTGVRRPSGSTACNADGICCAWEESGASAFSLRPDTEP